jgi:hypothetical protein
LQSNGHVATVIDDVTASDDYFAKQGGTNEQFIRGLYQDFLGRASTNTETDYWLNYLNLGDTRLQVAALFTSSQIFQTQYVTDLFQQYLRRPPTSAELSTYTSLLQNGASDSAILGALLGSDEYFTVHPA